MDRTLIGIMSLAASLTLACGAATGGATDGGAHDAGSGARDAGQADAGAGDAGIQDAGSTTDAGSVDTSCGATLTTAETLPLDMYIMLDRSGSMAWTADDGSVKWTAVTSALESFFASAPAGVSAGIQYFGLDDSSCSTDLYATPAVKIAALAGDGGQVSELTASIAAQAPSGGTPTYAALQGAIQYCSSWAASNSGHVVVTVLATDGVPDSTCDDAIADIAALADAGYHASPSIRTFVIGIGDALSSLNAIAAAGGTTSAIMVGTTDGGTDGGVNAQFLAALNAIRGSALACTYAIPSADGGTQDYTKVNVLYTPGGSSTAQTISRVSSSSSCSSSSYGWYYDQYNVASGITPSQIILCPSTCTTVSADSSGTVQIAVGCTTEVAE